MKRLPPNRLLMLQMIYCFLGIMYNVGSLLALRNGRPAWASTDPLLGVVGMSLYGLFLSSGLMKTPTFYRVLMGVSIVLFGYTGVLTHVLNFGHLDQYQSVWTWAGAIGVNSFGLVLNLAAALGRFVQKQEGA